MGEVLIEKLSIKLERLLGDILDEREQVRVKLQGAFAEALVCTDTRIIIIKTGFMTGHWFGSNVFQIPYERVTNVEVKFHLISGYFEVATGGMQNMSKSFWASSSERDPTKAPNCISITKSMTSRFSSVASMIMGATRLPSA